MQLPNSKYDFLSYLNKHILRKTALKFNKIFSHIFIAKKHTMKLEIGTVVIN